MHNEKANSKFILKKAFNIIIHHHFSSCSNFLYVIHILVLFKIVSYFSLN